MNRKLTSALLTAALMIPAMMPVGVFASQGQTQILSPSMSISEIDDHLSSGASDIILEPGDYTKFSDISFEGTTVHIVGSVTLEDLSLQDTVLAGQSDQAVLYLKGSFTNKGNVTVSALKVQTNEAAAAQLKTASLINGAQVLIGNQPETPAPENETVTVVFDANGGRFTTGASAGVVIETAKANQPVSVPQNVVYEGHTLVGWSADPNGSGGSLITGSTYTTDKTQIMYAIWKKNEPAKPEESDGQWVKTADGSYMFKKPDGSYIKNQMADIRGETYYFNAQGIMVTGFVSLNNQTYYFAVPYGAMATGWKDIDGSTYYFDQDGKMRTGVTEISGHWYYLEDGRMQRGWQDFDDGWNYFNNQGQMVFGFQTIDGNTYHFDEDGVMADNEFVEVGPYSYYFDDAGHMKTGWLKQSGFWYFFDQDGRMAVGWAKDDGKWYYMDQDGKMASTRWIRTEGHSYFVDSSGAMKTGWLHWKGDWYYLLPGGAMAVNTTIDGYQFNASGICLNP